MSRITDMTSGNPTKLIFQFAVPLILANVGQQLYMIVDAMIVGQGLGVEALASLGATDWVYWLVLWSVLALTQGFAILITQKFGEGDYKAVRKSITMSILLSVVIGVLITIISLMAAKPLLQLLNTPSNIIQGSQTYLTTMYLGTLIVMAYNMSAAILRAFGDGKTPLIAMGIAALINIGLDSLFIMVFKWGIIGAAIATLIAQMISFIYCAVILSRIDFLKFTKADWIMDKQITKELCRLGFPLMLQHVFVAVGGVILQSVINSCGFIFVAAFTATNKLYGLLESSALSFGFATSTFIAQNYGAGNMVRIKEGFRKATVLALVSSVIISVVMLIGGKQILRLFIAADEGASEAILALAYQYLSVMSILLFILYLLHTYRNALMGLGNTMMPMVSGIVEFIMRVGVALIMPSLLGEKGLFLAEPAAWTGCLLVLAVAYYMELHKIKKRVQSSDRIEVVEEGTGITSN